MSKTAEIGWRLEVVRGQEVGRSFSIGAGASTLGNGLNGEPGIDLGSLEGSGPRRMAARQAQLECTSVGLSLCDLDSPGGTFVNRQRILPGQSCPLRSGDVIQLGAVQLRVVEATTKEPTVPAATTPPRPGPLPAPYTLATGAVCRSWDDFLTVSAQSWTALRDELGSGRLTTFLRSIGRPDLVPPASSAALDERLDAWLGRLPATRAATPELEVQPATLRIRAIPGGGTTRQRLAITNTGYRLLRSTLRVEPPTAWVRVPPEYQARPFTTAEHTEVPIDVMIPESLSRAMKSTIVVESNGGSRRIEVVMEASPKEASYIDSTKDESIGIHSTFREHLSRLPLGKRVLFGAIGSGAIRGCLLMGDVCWRIVGGDTRTLPSMGGAVLILGALGALGGAHFTNRRGEKGDLPFGAFAGGFAGVLMACLAVAASRAVEPAFGRLLALPLWTLIGALAGLVSMAMVPVLEPEAKPI